MIGDSPADQFPGIQVDDRRQIRPTPPGFHIRDITMSFLVRPTRLDSCFLAGFGVAAGQLA
jgi:hypothetical protein